MKPLTQNRIFSTTIYNFQPLITCLKNGLKESFWRSLFSWWQVLSTNALSLARSLRQYVTLGWIAGNEIYSNDRHLVGTVMLMVSPVFWWAHLFFDYSVIIKGWYYKNFFFWFFTNREELMIGVGLLGFFLLCPLKWGYRFLLTPIIALCLSEIVYQSLLISHWTHFYRSMFSYERSWQMAVLVIMIIVAFSKFLDYTVYRKCHLRAGNEARRTGIKSLDIPQEQKEPVLKVLKEEYENFNARV